MFYQWEQHPNQDRRHRPRTRNGCLTCRKRKVRCDEKRPDCGHCSRLRLDCSWEQDHAGLRYGVRTKKVRQRLQQQPHNVQPEPDGAEEAACSVTDVTLHGESLPGDDPSFNRMFNYASFMWEDYSSNLSPSWDLLDLSSSDDLVPCSDASLTGVTALTFQYSSSTTNDATLIDRYPRSSLPSPMGSTQLAIGWSEAQLAEYFARSAAPPILATVETSARWCWMRKQLISMTSTSRMVKSGVIAFVALELESAGTLEPATYTQYYRSAKQGLEECLRDIGHDRKIILSQLRHILAVLFLLSYIDLLTKDVSKAHANLREGFNALQMVEMGTLRITEKRLLSWLRLLDARAVSAGGEGLFLTEEDSAINTDLRSPDSSIGEVDSGLDDAEAALEDFVMRPAYLFFQKVQLFMGRVSKIDPWHRQRGTVEDETEVMAIAASITRDIKSLWQERPPLMDHAVAGRLSTLLSPGLAETITRTMRVYHANYHASFFQEVASASPLPIVVYNFPGVASGLNVTSEMLEILGEHPNIAAVKLTCGSIASVARSAAKFGRALNDSPAFVALAGQSDWLIPCLSVGGAGSITGLANLYPKTCVELFNLHNAGSTAQAEQLQLQVAVAEWGFAKGGINGTKWVVAKILGYPEESSWCRRPYPKFVDEEKRAWITKQVKGTEKVENGL